MRKALWLAVFLSIGGALGSAQDDEDYVPTQGATSLSDARSSGQGLVLGSNAGGNVPGVYTVRRGDTLWDITGRYYGNPYHWPRVWSYNPEITNPHWIYPMDHIRLRPEGEAQAALPSGPTVVERQPRPGAGTVRLRDQGYLEEDALEDVGVIIGSPEENMLLSTFDDVYVRFGEDADVRPGTDYTVFREIDLDEERENDEEGVLVRILGVIRLKDYDPEREMGRGTITEALDPIERGYHLAPIPRRFDMVPPRENSTEVVAEVVAALEPRELNANAQVVFVNKGSADGVQVGNRFFVVRQGDQWRRAELAGSGGHGETVEDAPEPDDEEQYLPEVVAEGRVVNVRENTSALFITGATQPIVIGDRAEMRQGF
ncbi:MAG: LysM peptidoglycan-binding domain-containing protein [Deltaproteobacteria bacterium]|nr:LysM peptidoglycan-binding domain-containing protein [Deltaproteobacteria bacterium]